MDKEQALQDLWGSFGVPAYDSSTVPKDATLPRITYQCSVDSFGTPVFMTASIWDRSTSWASVTALKNQISNAIGFGGILKHYDGGAMWITRGNPFAQRMQDTDDSIRRIVLSVVVEFISED